MPKKSVTLEIAADASRAEKELKKTERQLAYFKRQAAGAGKGAGAGFSGLTTQMGLAAGATYMAGKAFGFMKGAVNQTQELTLASAKLATMTKMDATESAQWVLMARSRGVSAKQLNQSFLSLSRNIQAATNGSKAQVTAFQRLGVSQQMIKRGNPGEIMRQVAEGLKNVKSGSERAALAQRMFGRGAQGLIGVMASGKKGVEEQLGAFKDQATAMAGATKDAKELAANKRKLNAALDNVKTTLGAAFIPVLNQVTSLLTKFASLGPDAKRAIMSLGVAAGIAIGIMKMVQAFQALTLIMEANPIILIASAIAIAAFLIIANWGKVKQFLGAVWGWIKTAFQTVVSFVVSAARKGFLGPVAWIIANWGKVKAFLASTWNWIKNAFSAGGAFIANAARRGFLGPIPWIISHWKQVLNFFKSIPGKIAGFISSIPGKIGNLISRFAEAGRKLGRSLANGLSNAIQSAGGFLADAGQSIRNWINKNTLFDDNVSFSVLGHKISFHIPALATGGFVNGGQIAMIGEDGPEAVIPLSKKHRARGAALYEAAGEAMGMNANGSTFVVNNYGNQLDENQLAARFAWQLQTRKAF